MAFSRINVFPAISVNSFSVRIQGKTKPCFKDHAVKVSDVEMLKAEKSRVFSQVNVFLPISVDIGHFVLDSHAIQDCQINSRFEDNLVTANL